MARDSQKKSPAAKQTALQKRVHDIFDHILTGVVIIDETTHTIVDINPAALKMIGLPKEKIIGRVCHDFICPAEKCKCPITDLHQSVDNSERILLSNKGKKTPVLKTVTSMTVDAHTYLIESFVDISKQKTAEESLIESEKKYRLIFENANDIIVLVDKYGKILNVNKQLERVLGYAPDEVTGKSFSEAALLKARDIPKLLRLFIEIVRGKKEINLFELELTHKNGSTVNVEINTERLEKNGRLEGFLSLIRDITERKRIYIEKHKLEQKLHQSEKMETIGQLAGGIAHDFNNQLASIIGFADLIKIKMDNKEALKRYTENILTVAHRSAHLTKQMLAFARKGKYRNFPVNIHKLISDVVTLLEHTIEKKVAIKQNLNANRSISMGDASQLQNAILNLALNARDAMPNGGNLTFETSNEFLDEKYCKKSSFNLKKGDFIRLSVSDTGTGIEPKVMKHIFEPFFTTKEVGKGTGMGLAAVFGTVCSHNGAITAFSEVGKGATFTLYLPVAANEERIAPKSISSDPAPVKNNASILLIDDETLFLDVMKETLEEAGFTLQIYKSGREAVTFYKKSWKQVDLVILDLIMPDMDGRDVFIELKKINPDVKVLLSSGFSLEAKAIKLLENGAKAFIQKPYSTAELIVKITESLE